jgi:peptidoglycan/xylan/chitin deacetylase (PgdA/CDA1 family)
MKLTPTLVAKLAYRWGTRVARRPMRPHGFILMYHRIASPVVDPWNISVSPENFAGHMQALSDFADVVPLEELPGRLRKGRRSRPVAAVTFDDGYLDNLAAAKPVLDALDLPATIFVPTGWIGDPRPMWWDRLSHALLAPDTLPESLALSAHGQDFSWQAPEVGRNDAAGRRARASLHREVWTRMRKLPDDNARQEVVDALVAMLDTDEGPVADARPLTWDELRDLAAGGRFSVGSHSVSHPTLPGLCSESKAREIEDSARQLEQFFGRRPGTFAYPYGDLDDESVELVRAAGYALACSIREDLMWEGDDPHLLPRIDVGNWSAGEFRKRLGWYWLA